MDSDRREQGRQGVGILREKATFVSGWFTQRHEAGHEPDYGVPQGTLPKTEDVSVTMVTGFMSAGAARTNVAD